jgi:hypothetical protein
MVQTSNSQLSRVSADFDLSIGESLTHIMAALYHTDPLPKVVLTSVISAQQQFVFHGNFPHSSQVIVGKYCLQQFLETDFGDKNQVLGFAYRLTNVKELVGKAMHYY